MRSRSLFSFSAHSAGAALALGLGLVAAARGEPPQTIVIEAGPVAGAVQVIGGGEPGGPGQVIVSGTAVAIPAGKYWIGAHLMPLDELVRSHLKLKHGLVVQFVAPESPAAKAGLKVHDILLRYGDVEVVDQAKLIEEIEKHGSKPVEVRVLREGSETTLKLEAAERPPQAVLPFPRPLPRMPDEVQQWFGSLEEGAGPKGLRGFFLRPGIIAQGAAELEMPADLSIAVAKQGQAPAKITVKQGEKTWETTEDKLDVLPDEVRPHVQRLLGGPFEFNLELDGQKFGPPGIRLPGPVPGGAPHLERRFHELRKMIDELEQHFQALEESQEPQPPVAERLKQRLKERRVPRESEPAAPEAPQEPNQKNPDAQPAPEADKV